MEWERIIRFHPVSAYLNPQAKDSLHQEFKQAAQSGAVDPFLLIDIYIFDFLFSHPFIDGNGRMSTLYLLYEFGYEVGRYISLEKVIEENKESYYDNLQNLLKIGMRATFVTTLVGIFFRNITVCLSFI